MFNDFKKIVLFTIKLDKYYVLISFVHKIVGAILPFIPLVYGAKILNDLAAHSSVEAIIKNVYLLVGLTFVLSIIKYLCNLSITAKSKYMQVIIDANLTKKNNELDYEQLESTYMKDLLQKADQGSNSSGGISSFIENLGAILQSLVTVVYALFLLSSIFTKSSVEVNSTWVDFLNSHWSSISIFVVIIISVAINFLIMNRNNQLSIKFFEQNVQVNRLAGYYIGLTADYEFGKDARVNGLKVLVLDLGRKFNRLFVSSMTQLTNTFAVYATLQAFILAVVLFICYVIIGSKAMYGIIPVGSVISLVGAISTFTNAINTSVEHIGALSMQRKYMLCYFNYLETTSNNYKGTLPIEKRDDSQYEIEFRNVSFHYPNSNQMVLNDVSMKLNIGEKLAIVGQNGAGKTTFIKLLSRLYEPTSGEILLNGIDIRKYDYKEYLSIFSVVFQDFKLLSLPLAQNVAASEDYDEDRVWDSLEKAGVKDRVERMSQKLDTILYQDNEQGVEISGGEAQKIALARALYKDAPIVILDEPTSALDPISEAEIYSRFNEMVTGKTAIYISHRMSSCRFCNKVLVFDQGSIIQSGSHDQLVSDQAGLYYQMWASQAEYYN